MTTRALPLAVLASLAALACGGPARIETEPTTLRFFGRGQSLKVHAAPVAKSGRPLPNSVCAWSSSDEKVATVSGPHNEATVTSAGPGSATIRCKIGGVSAEVPVTVRVVARVEATPAKVEVKILDEATPVPLQITAVDDTGALVVGRAMRSRCANEEICRGDQRGQIWGVAPGETTATVEVEGASSPPVAVKVVDARTAEGRPQRVKGNPMEATEKAVRERDAAEAKARAKAEGAKP